MIHRNRGASKAPPAETMQRGNGRHSPPSELLDRTPPHDADAELMLLRAIVLDSHLLDSTDLTAAHFTQSTHRQIFAALATLRENQRPIDIRHLRAELLERGHLDAIGGGLALAELLTGDALPARTKDYLRTLHDKLALRQALAAHLEGIKDVHSGRPAGDVLVDARDRLAEIKPQSRKHLTFRTLTCAQLDAAECDVVYHVAETFAADQPMILAGPPKSLKTSVLTDLAVSLATGTAFLGVYSVPRPLRVCVMSGESGDGASRICFRSVASAKGYDLAAIENLFWSDCVPRIGTPEHMAATREHLRKYRPDVLAIDPAFQALAAARPEDLFAMGGLLGSINDLCRSEGATFVLVHHSRKPTAGPYAPTTLDDISYAGFREFFRQWILLSRRSQYETGAGIHELRVDVGGSARHSWCAALTIDEGRFREPHWSVLVRSIAESKEAQENAIEKRKRTARADKLHRERAKLLEAVAHFPGGETITQLRIHAGLSGESARLALAEALRLGEVATRQLTKNKRKVDGYILASGQPD